MKPILTLADFESELKHKYGNHNKNVIALMLAPYNQEAVKKIVDQYYHTWHIQAGQDLDMFWIGYGVQQDKHHDEQDYIMPLTLVEGNREAICFNLNHFLAGTQDINHHCSFVYHEDFELVLFNYENGHVNYYDHFRIDLQSALIQNHDLRELITMIIRYTKEGKSIRQLKAGVKLKLNMKRFRKIKLNDLLSYMRQAGMLVK